MKLQDIIKHHKEDILSLFCELYGKEFYQQFSEKFNQVTILCPNLYEDDLKKCLDELCDHPNNIDSYKRIILFDTLSNNNLFGQFIPIARKNKNGQIHTAYFIIINIQKNYQLQQNLDLLLLHELDHLMTHNSEYLIENNNKIIINNKVGLSCISETYQNKKLQMQQKYYQDIGEVLTQFNATIMTKKLHEHGEIFPNQCNVLFENCWHEDYFNLLLSLDKNDLRILRYIELADNYMGVVNLTDQYLIEKLDNYIKKMGLEKEKYFNNWYKRKK